MTKTAAAIAKRRGLTTTGDRRLKKPCPDLPKGQRCGLCGGTYVCLQPERKKLRRVERRRA
jgi:hypothetical protein